MTRGDGPVETVQYFVRGVVEGRRENLSPERALFEAVRDLPYALDGAHDAQALVQLGRGDCLAKSALLRDGLWLLGMPARRVRWAYQLPAVVPEVDEPASRLDVHTAVQALVAGGWILLDATHDLGLAASGLQVNTWDGSTATEPAYPPRGPVLVEGRDDAELADLMAQVLSSVALSPSCALARWRHAHIAWLSRQRADGAVGFTLRPATRADDEFLYSLHRSTMSSYVAATWGAWEEVIQREFHERWFDPRRLDIVLLAGVAIGVLDVTPADEDALYLARVELLPRVQGRGIGGALLERVLQTARNTGRTAVVLDVLEVNPVARLYERLGFRVERTIPPRVRMRLDVPPSS